MSEASQFFKRIPFPPFGFCSTCPLMSKRSSRTYSGESLDLGLGGIGNSSPPSLPGRTFSPSVKGASAVEVFVRVRPTLSHETVKGWETDGTKMRTLFPEIRQFELSKGHVFDEHAITEEVYKRSAQPTVQSTLEGFNGYVFAYGQTSAGKTHTMIGNDHEPGVIQYALRDLFDATTNDGSCARVIRLSYLELYNEQLYDLLDDSERLPYNISFQEDRVPSFVIWRPTKLEQAGGPTRIEAKCECVASVMDALSLIEKGEKNRTYGATAMNVGSSRSHTLLRVQVHTRDLLNSTNRIGELFLIDLAGSENAHKTGAVGDRLMESAFVNKSLSALIKVVRLLEQANRSGKQPNVVMRDSKLTQFLQPALGGNAKCVIICAVTPAQSNVSETISTLQFAASARSLITKPTIVSIDHSQATALLQQEAYELQKMLAHARERSFAAESKASQQEEQIQMLAERVHVMQNIMGADFDKRMEEAEQRFHSEKQAREEAESKLERLHAVLQEKLSEHSLIEQRVALLQHQLLQSQSTSPGGSRGSPLPFSEREEFNDDNDVLTEYTVMSDKSTKVAIIASCSNCALGQDGISDDLRFIEATNYLFGRGGCQRDVNSAVRLMWSCASVNHPRANVYLSRWHRSGFAGVKVDKCRADMLVRKSAIDGDTFAKAYCMLKGIYGPQDFEQAFAMLNDLDSRDPLVQCEIGSCYVHGTGVKKDRETAVMWYRRAAEQGDPTAQFNLAVCYEDGQGIAQDVQVAVVWYQQAADQHHARAQYNLGICYSEGRGVPKNEFASAKWYQAAADQDLACAQFIIGVCFSTGTGVDRDECKAVEWYRKAAHQGDAEAQYHLGACYDGGVGVVRDPRKAVEWYGKAAERGHASAQFNLAVYYASGYCLPKDDAKAAELYIKAAKQGLSSAQYNLAVVYDNGSGVPQDHLKAIEWYRAAAEQGLANAQFNLGICYEHGRGVAKDPGMAVTWYLRAADQGLAHAQCNLASCFTNGVGVPVDLKIAFEWYRKAATAGLANAQFCLGVCLEEGRGTLRDEKKALEWYEKAAAQGLQCAAEVLREFGSVHHYS